jgi:hypothetical protein
VAGPGGIAVSGGVHNTGSGTAIGGVGSIGTFNAGGASGPSWPDRDGNSAMTEPHEDQDNGPVLDLPDHGVAQVISGDVTGYLAPNRLGPYLDSSFPESPDLGVTPVLLYLDTEAHADDVENALATVLEAFGLTVVQQDPPVRRSWFRRLTVLFRRAEARNVASRLVRELDRAVELRAVDQVQAQVDAAQGDAVAKLLTALGTTPNALIQIGSVLLLKVDGVPMVRNLTQLELTYLQRNPQLSHDPRACLRTLREVADRATNHLPHQTGLPTLPMSADQND